MRLSDILDGARSGGLLTATAFVVALVTAVGFALRVALVQQSLLADEMSTYWIIAKHVGLSGVYDVVHSDAEITPPLYFLLAKLTTQIELTPPMIRLPSLLAGTASIPLTYIVGLRTIGARVGIVGAALVAFSPFMIYYSTEARGYALVVFLVLLSTLALLRAIDRGGLGWWIAYGVLSSAAMYTHYTAAFPLAGQALWAIWAHPRARRGVLFANVGAAVAFMPWFSGLLADFNSPTTAILGALQPFTPDTARISLEHWSIGFPYGLVPLGSIPGTPALVLLGMGVGLALVGLIWSLSRSQRILLDRIEHRLALVTVLALSVLVGEATFSLFSTSLFGVRNLATAWPPFALLLAALLCSGRRIVSIVSTTFVIVAFGWGGAKVLEPRYQRPDFASAADLILKESDPPGVVIAARSPSPGPLSPIDVHIHGGYRIFRLGLSRRQPGHPFATSPPLPSPRQITSVVSAKSGRLFFVTPYGGPGLYDPTVSEILAMLPKRFRLVEKQVFDGLIPLAVLVFDSRGRSGSQLRPSEGQAVAPASSGGE